MNIEKYNFKGDARSARIDKDGDIEIEVCYNTEDIYFTKEDIIAMALAIGVTSDDLVNPTNNTQEGIE